MQACKEVCALCIDIKKPPLGGGLVFDVSSDDVALIQYLLQLNGVACD